MDALTVAGREAGKSWELPQCQQPSPAALPGGRGMGLSEEVPACPG